jgi:hypothetical protein
MAWVLVGQVHRDAVEDILRWTEGSISTHTLKFFICLPSQKTKNLYFWNGDTLIIN